MAREIEFSIDTETGELTTHIKGIAGPGCDDVAKLVQEYIGEPVGDTRTPEYYLRPQMRTQVRGKQGYMR